jgi:methylmalonyl-CoA mutase
MPEKSILEKIQASFHSHGKSDWLAAASTEVKGKNPFELLQWQDEGLKFSPYNDITDVQHLDNQATFNSPSLNSFLGPRAWSSISAVSVDDEKNANQLSHIHVMHGADGILFEIEKPDVRLPYLLENLEWPYCQVSFVSAAENFAPEEIIKYCRVKGYKAADISGAIFWKKKTPLNASALTDFGDFKNFKPLGFFIEASTTVQEITDALLYGVTAIESLSTAHAIDGIAFSLPTGTDFLLAVAKLRALRMLWYQVSQAYGHHTYDPTTLHLHARSDAWVNEDFQPHSNLLKSTTASIAAICGGCNSITVYPEQRGNTLMERMARNTSVILREESHFNKVSDPLAGAYAVEKITHELAKEAWTRFQSLTHQA